MVINGVGIRHDYHDVVFDIFHRLTPENSAPAMGIGLTIAKRIVLRHDGEIWLESEVGKGTRFYVSLPKRRERVPAYLSNITKRRGDS